MLVMVSRATPTPNRPENIAATLDLCIAGNDHEKSADHRAGTLRRFSEVS